MVASIVLNHIRGFGGGVWGGLRITDYGVTGRDWVLGIGADRRVATGIKDMMGLGMGLLIRYLASSTEYVRSTEY